MNDGILNLDKPRGPTSHDVVERVRALTGVRQVGHAGTLDPLATGVLLVCVGRATRLAEYLLAGHKVYRATLRLGIVTDTYDAEGTVVAEFPVRVGRAEVEGALASFRGPLEQQPPLYSAVKHAGTPLHKYARRGLEVPRVPRRVEVYTLTLVEWRPPECVLDVECSSGTYVRALAHDLGQTLGCGAHLTALERLASGEFRLEDALSLSELERAAQEGHWREYLLPLDRAVARLPVLHLDREDAQDLCTGRAVAAPAGQPVPVPAEGEPLARAYGPGGAFLAVVAYDAAHGLWRPRKVFC